MTDETDDGTRAAVPASWWRDGVLYQIYPALVRGLRRRRHRRPRRHPRAPRPPRSGSASTGIWLNPTMPSPNDDWGYDVADYCDVHPDLGTLDDLDALVAAARERGIRVLLDLVPNHTSDRHPWFADALTGRDARAPRLLRLGPARTRRRPAEQLGLELRRLGVDAARADGRVLPRPVPADAARSELVERGGPRALRRHPALLVRRAASRASGSTCATRSSRIASCATTRR